MSDEIDGIKARQSTLEDELLEIMEALEPLDARIAVGTAERADLDARLVTGQAALIDAEAAVDAELAGVSSEHDEAAGAVPAPLLARYERLRSHLGGVAVATLDGPRCTGCNLTLPTSELERIRLAAPDDIVECEQCGRILVR